MGAEYKGRITASVGGLYTVLTEIPTPSGRHVTCRPRGVFRHKHEKPLVGDIVDISYTQEGDADCAAITNIHTRKNSLIRPPVANLDYIYVTMASSSPAPDTETVDKLICIAEYNGIKPVIIIGKSELDPVAAARLSAVYRLTGYDSFAVSCHSGEGTAELMDFIRATLPGHTAAFAGASGVGKSSLVNAFFPGLELETSEISRKTERGRHTTRQVSLYPVLDETSEPGFIADTPGFSMLDFERFDFFSKDDLPGTFREFAPYIGRCRYSKCSHTKEEGCAVIAAVGEGKIARSRHASYIKLHDILKTKNPWDAKQDYKQR